ncbi:hypothetical protein Unana1_00582 [Umbelopsis nana]
MECGEWNFTPSLSTFASEMNPFDYIGVQKAKEGTTTTTAVKQDSPPTPPNSKEYNSSDRNKDPEGENTADAPPTPPQPKAKGVSKRRSQEVSRENVSSNSSLDSESSETSGEQATGMKALTKAVEIESQQLKKQRQLQKQQQQQQLMGQQSQNTTAKHRSKRSQPHQLSFHSYQPSKPAHHPSIPAPSTNTILIIKQENGQPNTRTRRNKDKVASSHPPDTEIERKRRNSDDDDEAAERRRRFLERNRVAASKCRQKKKAWVNELEQTSEKVVEDNKRLNDMVIQLKEEAMFLKNQLLAHGTCNCDVVKQYLKQSAELASAPDAGAQAQSQQMLPPPPQLPQRQKQRSSNGDYFAPVHSTPTPSLPPLPPVSIS